MKEKSQSQFLGVNWQSLENIPPRYLHYGMCKFLTWRQVDRVVDLWMKSWHYYLTVKKAVFNNNKAHKGNKFVTLRGIIVMSAAIFFPYSTFEGCFPRSAGNP